MSEIIGKDIEFNQRKVEKYNVVKNTFKDFIELVFYKEEKTIVSGNFDFETGEYFVKEIDRSRKFFEDNGVLKPLKDSQQIEKLQNTIKSSRKRALDNLFGYALCNEWQYFVTLTFNPTYVDRDNDEDCKYHYSLFRQKLQYYFKDVKILAIPERHPTSGKLHIHALVGNCDLDSYLFRAINPHTNKQIYSNGRVVYNLTLFDFGYSTLVKCDKNQLKVVNYLTKYIVKDFGNLGYNKKTFFRTHNLDFKNKEFYLYNPKKKKDFLNLYSDFIQVYKETDDCIIYRYELPFKEGL